MIESRQNSFIKVVTGIRRCGKSYLLNVLFYHYLLDNGVADDHIIRIDLKDRMNKELRNPDTMLHYLHDRIKDRELYYIIIDKAQLMDEFMIMIGGRYFTVDVGDKIIFFPFQNEERRHLGLYIDEMVYNPGKEWNNGYN